jgi:serine/threonine protein kinase
LLAELARGGMGIVHLAEARGPGGFEKLVVVKELKAELTDDPVYCAMFLDEARLAARLSHRHIVQTNEVGCEGGRYFMALELLEGGSLHQIRSKLGLRALPPLMTVRVLVAVLDALHHAHELTDAEGASLGVVHRDVSPQNVFLTFDGGVKLIDFGVAKSKDRRGAAITRVGVVKGSVPYMSPDHVDGGIIDRRADVFAAGVILRELLCGERLWGEAGDLAILRALIARDLPAFPEAASAAADVPAALRAIVLRAMAPHRADRYPTAAAMRDALEGYLTEHDPRGSLDDLGTWLEQNLVEERLAFRALVKTSAFAKTKADVWLPSCDLRPRFSGPPVLPALAPPLPAEATTSAKPGRARLLAASAALVAMLGIAALGAARSPPQVTPAGVTSPTHQARVPHVVDGDVKVSIATRVLGEAPDEDDIVESRAAVGEPAISAPMRASILSEPLPPNPYPE